MIPFSTVVWHFKHLKLLFQDLKIYIILTAFQRLRGVPLTTKTKGRLFPVLCLLF
jgi:hypothetical protein